MAINLLDLRSAVAAAIDSVTVTVSAPVPAVPLTINPNETFTFNVTASNQAAGTIRFVNVSYHLSISGNARLLVPSSPPARAVNDPAAPTLAVGAPVSSMFLFPTDDTLDVNDTDTLAGLQGQATTIGPATITCHIHGDPDMGFLFPLGEIGLGANRAFSVV